MSGLTRGVVALVVLVESAGFFVGSALHLGWKLPLPIFEPRYVPSGIAEAACGALLLIVAAAIAVRHRRAWPLAVIAHVTGEAAIVFGIAARVSGAAPRVPFGQSQYYSAMLLLLVLTLIALVTPPCREALGSGRRGPWHRSRRRYRRRGRRARDRMERSVAHLRP